MSEAQANVERLRALLAAVDAGDIDAALACYAPDYHDHDASDARAGADALTALRHGFRMFAEAFSDVQHSLDDAIADGDRVAARISVEARHTGAIFGVPPTGRLVRNDSIVIYRFERGLIRERWCRERRATRELLRAAATAALPMDNLHQ